MSIKRRKFTGAEKSKIVLECIKGEQTIAQLSARYEIHPTQINQWKKQALLYLPEAFGNKVVQEKQAHESELSGLYQEIGKLTVENEFLKKKSELFRG